MVALCGLLVATLVGLGGLSVAASDPTMATALVAAGMAGCVVVAAGLVLVWRADGANSTRPAGTGRDVDATGVGQVDLLGHAAEPARRVRSNRGNVVAAANAPMGAAGALDPPSWSWLEREAATHGWVIVSHPNKGGGTGGG